MVTLREQGSLFSLSRFPDFRFPLAWLRPEIEPEIKFTEWTTGDLRHAEFVTLRDS